MRSSFRVLLSACFLIAVLVPTVWCEAPKLMSYQGRATDISGNPVADGNHDVEFRIYDKFNNLRWSESSTVSTSGGLFSHNLGSTNPLDPTAFNWNDSMFLQITVDGEVQSPRTVFTAVPYSYHVNSIDGSIGGIVKEYVFVHSDAADDEVMGLTANTGNGNIWMKDIDGHSRIELKSDSRSLEFYNFDVTSTPAKISSQGSSITINPDQTGNDAVILPSNAVSSGEILNEPGIAYNTVSFETGQTLSNLGFIDIVTVTVDIPSAGYITLQADAVMSLNPISGGSWLLQIDETAGGSPGQWNASAVWCVSKDEYNVGFCQGVYYKTSPGSYTFRLEGTKGTDPCMVWKANILATFSPTSYGSVASLVAGNGAGQFEQSEAVTDKNGQTLYKVDLRELELRVARAEAEAERARADAEKAQREFLRAKYETQDNEQ